MKIDLALSAVLRSAASFEELINIAGLDPLQDLRGCDFSHVDFGDFSQRLDLSNCNLYNADLRRVRGKMILDGAQLAGALFSPGQIESLSAKRLNARSKFDLIKRAIISIHRFQIPYSISEQLSMSFDWSVPIVLFYRSPVEKERLQTEIRKELGSIIRQRLDTWPIAGGSETTARLIEVQAGSLPNRFLPKNGEAADYVFFRSMMNSRSEAIIDVSMRRRGAQRYVDYTAYGNPIHSQAFASASKLFANATNSNIGREGFRQFLQRQMKDGISALFFNDTTLFSADLAKMLREDRMKCGYVFLLNHDLMAEILDRGSKNKTWPKVSYVRPRFLLNKADINALTEVINSYKKAGLYLSEDMMATMASYEGRPARELKNMLIDRLQKTIIERNYAFQEFIVI